MQASAYKPRPGEKLYSNRLKVGYLKLMDERAGKAATDAALARYGLDRLKLTDMSGFVDADENDRIMRAAREVTGEEDIGYVVGRNMTRSVGNMQGFIMGITSPSMLMRTFGKIESSLALKTIASIKQIGPDTFQSDITFRD